MIFENRFINNNWFLFVTIQKSNNRYMYNCSLNKEVSEAEGKILWCDKNHWLKV